MHLAELFHVNNSDRTWSHLYANTWVAVNRFKNKHVVILAIVYDLSVYLDKYYRNTPGYLM